MSRRDRPIPSASIEDRGHAPSPASPDEGSVLADLVEGLMVGVRAGSMRDYRAGTHALTRERPDHAGELLELLPALEALAQVSASLPATASENAVGHEPPSPGVRSLALPNEGALGDFRLLGEVGRGGMGVVYEAEQMSLGRRVALKVLPFASALHPRQVQRFKNEALAAAQLHHTNIVPVYAVGCERGTHYYAMQFIDGHTLAEVVRALRQDAGQGTGTETGPATTGTVEAAPRPKPLLAPEFTQRGPAFVRRIAELMLQAAEALEYAHQVGVVHRDVKPANLMLDGLGHLWVTDFGLACWHRPGVEGGLTGTGELPGTLRYMSPEQALGRPAVVDHRTDVYALGATLYELLTLEPLCPGSTRQELLAQIGCEEPRPPRRLNRAVPVDLETIVLKAVAKNVAERYATAQELADDLRRFLEDRPILARRPSLLEQGNRWLRRHRTVAWAAVVVVLVAIAGLAGSTVLVARQRDKAEARRRQARQVVDRMYTDVAEKWLAQQPHLEPLQREYLQLALKFYEDLMSEDSRSPDVRLATGQAARRVGDIRQKLGEYDRAEEAYARAAEVLQSLAADHPGLSEARAEQGALLNHRGNLLRRRRQLAESREAYRQARDLFAELLRGSPGEPTYSDGLAGSYNNLGMVEHNLGRIQQAEAAYRQALSLLRRLTADHPGQPARLHDLASCYNNFGYLLNDLGRRREAESSYQSALALWQAVARELPGVVGYRQAEAACLHNLGNLRAACGRPRDAEQAYRAALARRARLAENFPQAIGYRQELAASQFALGAILTELGRFPEAEALLRRAFLARSELATAFPREREFRRDLAASHHGFGRLLATTGRPRQAEEAYRAALTLRAGRQESARTLHHLGVLVGQSGRSGEAEKLYRQALAAFEGPNDRERPGPAPVSLRAERGELWSDLGRLLHTVGRTAEAERAYRKAEALMHGSTDPAAEAVLAEVHDRVGALLYEAGRREEATKRFELARTGRAKLAKDHPHVATFHGRLAWFLAHCPDGRFRDPAQAVASASRARDLAPPDGNQWARLGAARYRAGDWGGAAEALEKAVKLGNATTPADWVFLAMSRWRMGDQREAVRWYRRALSRQGKEGPVDEEWRRLQAEAESLIPQARAGPVGRKEPTHSSLLPNWQEAAR
jgi:serine/threonine protein kinase/Flp pilus assembly protein TadD